MLQVELQPLQVWLSAVHGADPRACWPTAGELSRHTASIIEVGLTAAGSRCAVVDVPLRCRPEDIRTFVQDHGIGTVLQGDVEVREIPPFARTNFAYIWIPGSFERSATTGLYFIQPVEDKWSERVVQEFLASVARRR